MRNLLFISLCLLSAVSFGQSNKFTFQIGSQYELPRKTEDLAFFGNDKDGIVNLSLKKEELNVVRFDPKSLNQTDDKVLNLDVTKNFNSEEVTDFYSGNYFWLHSDWDKEAKQESLYYDKVDIVTGKIISTDNKMLTTTKIAGTGDDMKGSNILSMKVTGKYKFYYSADHKKLLATYRLIPENRRDKDNFDKLGFYVFDDNMNKLWGGEFTMPYTEAVMSSADFSFSVDSKGNAYLLAKVYADDKRKEIDKETGEPGYHFEVLKFTKDSKTVNHTSIEVSGNFILETSLIENALHEMIIACTYSKKLVKRIRNATTDGIFLAMLNPAGQVVKYKNGYYEFPLADLEKYETERTKRKMEKKDDYEAPHIKVRNVMTQADGSIFIACEESYVTSTYVMGMNGGQSHTDYDYYYNDIIAAKINADGSFAWLRKIPKSQRKIVVVYDYGVGGMSITPVYYEGIMTTKIENGPGTLGFKLIIDSSGYYFLYLDNRKNSDLQEDEAPKTQSDGRGGEVVVSKLDMKGNLSKEILFDTKDEDIKVYPTQFHKINSNQFIGRAKVKRNLYEPLLITVK